MKKLLSTLQGLAHEAPPLWLMRQAGRYLPEYRATRAQAGGFLDLCYNPALAAAVTLQPIRRFDFDAAILFADILLIPHALGCNLRFMAGEGPQLDPVTHSAQLRDKTLTGDITAVYETVRRVRHELAPSKTLIGFCGAPFTVACYVVSGGGSKDFSAVSAYAQRDRPDFLALLDILATHSIDYLSEQIKAGADVIQLFESWAGLVSAADWQDFVVRPTRKIVQALHQRHPSVPLIGFPRGAGKNYFGYAAATGVQGVGLDQSVALTTAQALQEETVVQGNLDPILLVQGGKAQAEAVAAIRQALSAKPFIFNLGHGITPDTPLEHVAALVQQVRQT